MTFTAVGARGSDAPAAVVGDSWRAGAAYDPSEVPLHRFEAPSRDAAAAEFARLAAIGIRAAKTEKHGADRRAGPWRMKGSPYYLGNQAERLGVTMVTVEHPRVRDNKQLHKISDLLGQVQREYWGPQTPRRGDDRQFSVIQVRGVVAVLDQCEHEVSRLHAMAAASDEMVAEAYDAFGLPRPLRDFAVVAASDAPPGPPIVEVAAPEPAEPDVRDATAAPQPHSPPPNRRPPAKS